jgi:hypothetical protein
MPRDKNAAEEFEDALLAVRVARRFTPEGWQKYKAKHPGAKQEHHWVVQRRDNSPEGKAKSEAARKSIKDDLEKSTGKKIPEPETNRK